MSLLLEVGRVTRAHGLNGEVIVELVTDRVERLERGSTLTVGGSSPTGSSPTGSSATGSSATGVDTPTTSGARTLEVRSAKRFGGPHGTGRAARERWIVHFAGVEDRQGAEILRSRTLLAPPLEDPGAVWVHQLVGAQVLDADGGHLGVVAAVEANPASDLLVLENGGLVPMCFMTEEGVEAGTIVVDIPAGLLD